MATERNIRLSSFGDVYKDVDVVDYDDGNNNNNNTHFKSEWKIYMPTALKPISLHFSYPVCPCASSFPQGRLLHLFPWLVL